MAHGAFHIRYCHSERRTWLESQPQERQLRAARLAHRPEPKVVEARASTLCEAGRSLEWPLEYQVLSTTSGASAAKLITPGRAFREGDGHELP